MSLYELCNKATEDFSPRAFVKNDLIDLLKKLKETDLFEVDRPSMLEVKEFERVEDDCIGFGAGVTFVVRYANALVFPHVRTDGRLSVMGSYGYCNADKPADQTDCDA
jgi:hypothetical protein